MRTPKLYIGKTVRTLRVDSRATQAEFAARLGLSTSYLNQIENNQRPVSASVLMTLAERCQVDLRAIGAGEDDRLISALAETLADPLFEPYQAGLQELKLVAQNAPAIARALILAHNAYRRATEQLAGMDSRAESLGGLVEPGPYEEVRDFFHFVDNYLQALDVVAEKLAGELDLPEADPGAALTEYLETVKRVRVTRAEGFDAPLRRFDAHSNVLFLNPGLPIPSRNFQLAYQIGVLDHQPLIDKIASSADFRTPDATEICKIGLANYYAGALLLPYAAFRESARALRHDLELLAMRFQASLEQVAHRLSTLQRPGEKGVPVFFARFDRAGNITKRHSAAKLQFARYGGACPLWNVHQAFETPGRIVRQLAQTPDGVGYLCVATEIVKGHSGFKSDRRRYAIALGCESVFADQFVYADGLDIANKALFDPIGVSCRICERNNCSQRSVPPLRRRLAVNHSRRDVVPYIVE